VSRGKLCCARRSRSLPNASMCVFRNVVKSLRLIVAVAAVLALGSSSCTSSAPIDETAAEDQAATPATPTATAFPTPVPPPTPTPAPTPVPVAPEVAEALGVIDGDYIAVDAAPLGSQVDLTTLSATRFGQGWLAVADSLIAAKPVILVSADGLSWHEMPGEVTDLPAETHGPYELFALGDDVVLTGLAETIDNGADRALMAARSSDGLSWTRINTSRADRGFPNRDVARTGDGDTIGFLGEIDDISLDATTGWGAYVVHVLAAGIEPQFDIDMPPGFRATHIFATDSALVVNLVDLETSLYGLGVIDLETSSVIILGSVRAQSAPVVSATVHDTLFDFETGRHRGSLDFGRSWTTYVGPSDQPVSRYRFSPHGAVGDPEPPFQDAEYVQVSSDGLLWQKYVVPPQTADLQVLSYEADGALVLMSSRPQADNAISLLAFLPWPDDSSSLSQGERQSLIAARDEQRIADVTAQILGFVGAVDPGSLACVTANAADDEVSAVVDAILTCEVGYLDSVKAIAMRSIDAGLGSLNTAPSCVASQIGLLSSVLRATASTASWTDPQASQLDRLITRTIMGQHQVTVSFFTYNESPRVLGLDVRLAAGANQDRASTVLQVLMDAFGLEATAESMSQLLAGSVEVLQTERATLCSQEIRGEVIVRITVARLSCDFFAG